MKFMILLVIALIYTAISGGAAYFLATSLMPDRSRARFFEIVPLYPKRKYGVMLYGIATLLFLVISIEIQVNFLGNMLISLICVIVASQVVRAFAKIRKEPLEESFEEEMERKRQMLG